MHRYHGPPAAFAGSVEPISGCVSRSGRPWRQKPHRPPGLCVVGGTVQVGIAEVGALQVRTPYRLAKCSTAPRRIASRRSAPVKSTRTISARLRLARLRFALTSLAPSKSVGRRGFVPSVPSAAPAGRLCSQACEGELTSTVPALQGTGHVAGRIPPYSANQAVPDNSARRRRARSAGTHRLCGLQAPSRRALAMSTNRPAPDAAGGAAGATDYRPCCRRFLILK